MRTAAAVSAPARQLRASWGPLLLLATTLAGQPLRWTPAVFRGLTAGSSKRADAVRILGAPDAHRSTRGTDSSGVPGTPVVPPQQANHVLAGDPGGVLGRKPGEELVYKAKGDHKGDLAVRLDRSGVIVEIRESFPVAIPRSRIYKELGRDAVTAHYTRDRCGSFYRDPNGQIELTFYPARGIYLWPDQYGYDFAAIYYAARPPGVDRPPRCASRK